VHRRQVAEKLRRNHDLVATGAVVCDEVADDPLGVPAGVAVGGVDEVAAALEVAPHDRLGFGHG
jgi:hypothetical protein